MKILQVCTKVPYPPKDGGAAGVFMFSKALAQLGHSIAILAVNPPKHYIPIDEIPVLPHGIVLSAVKVDTDINILKAFENLLFSKVPYQVERFVDKHFESQLLNNILKFDPEIVQLEGLYLCPYISLIRKHSKAKIVFRAHNVEHVLWENIARNQSHLFKRIYLNIQAARVKRYEIAQFANVDAVTSVTENDLFLIKTFNPEVNACVKPFGIEIDDSRPLPYNVKAVSFIGALDWMPNQEAIQWFTEIVWPKVVQRFPHLELHVAGRNAPTALALLLKSSLGVIYHGEVDNSRNFLDGFSLMVVPLFAGSGVRVKIIEAMERGMVVIASSKAVEGIPAIHEKHLLIADSADAFVNEIDKVISNPAFLSEISANAVKMVREKFDIRIIASDLVKFYNEIIYGRT